jgi:uncharacterized membrane protein YphA (DoxX/SURF4 family)
MHLDGIFSNSQFACCLFIQKSILERDGMLVAQAVARSIPDARAAAMATAGIGIAAGFLMLIGLWTPMSCLLAVVAESWQLFANSVATQPAILLISVNAAVAMLGPGSWSIDAILFGRRRLDIL